MCIPPSVLSLLEKRLAFFQCRFCFCKVSLLCLDETENHERPGGSMLTCIGACNQEGLFCIRFGITWPNLYKYMVCQLGKHFGMCFRIGKCLRHFQNASKPLSPLRMISLYKPEPMKISN